MTESTFNRPIPREPLVAGRKFFVGFLALNGLMQLILGIAILVNFPTVAEYLMQISYTDDMRLLGMTIGVNVLFGAAVIAASIYWTINKNPAGVIAGAFFGVLAITAGLIVLVVFERTDGLMDVLRGVLIVAAASFAWHDLTESE